ncbi:MAG: HAMP domain-containing sensor histidine kinase, partial [Thermodesulfobacteriota bacterium]|nr:HAMP domain-containing sensor histidine kinase [Thermodesulfobacteriota bacterium]
MSVTCFFSLSILLFLWFVTCMALVVILRKRRASSTEPSSFHSELLVGLASAKYQEAMEASKRLREVADALHLGLVELKGNRINEINQSAVDLLPEYMRSGQSLTGLLASLQENSPRILELDQTAVQLSKLPISGSQDLVLVQDFTESFLMARKLKQHERLALLGQMTAQMAHQIKTPLAVLAGQAQMLARHLSTDMALKDQAESIYHEARDLAKQINEISNFYKEREPYFKDVELCRLLDDVKKRLDSLDHSCEISIECQDGINIETDPGLLQNLLFLLGQNALSSATAASLLSISAARDGEQVTIRVKDNGAGVPDAMRDKLFEPFASTKGEGLGLGLFLARDLTRQMGGSIELEEVEHGASFRLHFPIQRSSNS